VLIPILETILAAGVDRVFGAVALVARPLVRAGYAEGDRMDVYVGRGRVVRWVAAPQVRPLPTAIDEEVVPARDVSPHALAAPGVVSPPPIDLDARASRVPDEAWRREQADRRRRAAEVALLECFQSGDRDLAMDIDRLRVRQDGLARDVEDRAHALDDRVGALADAIRDLDHRVRVHEHAVREMAERAVVVGGQASALAEHAVTVGERVNALAAHVSALGARVDSLATERGRGAVVDARLGALEESVCSLERTMAVRCVEPRAAQALSHSADDGAPCGDVGDRPDGTVVLAPESVPVSPAAGHCDAAADRGHPPARAFRLRSVIADALDPAARRAAAGGGRVTWHLESDVPDGVSGDDRSLRDLLIALVDEALLRAPGGEVSVCARLALRRPSDLIVLIAVVDSGLGLSPERQAALLGSMRRSCQVGAGETPGAGLERAAWLARRLGGRLWLESDEAAGSAFRFAVSLGHLGAEASATPSAHGALTTAAVARDAGARPLVVVIDDAADERSRVVVALEAGGYRVVAPPDGHDALATVAVAAPDAVVVDLRMPRMDGFEVAAAIRACGGALAEVPIVALGLAGEAAEQARSIAAGIDAGVADPSNPATLLSLLDTLVRPEGMRRRVSSVGS
jgi:CheY-like chemotaxis protein